MQFFFFLTAELPFREEFFQEKDAQIGSQENEVGKKNKRGVFRNSDAIQKTAEEAKKEVCCWIHVHLAPVLCMYTPNLLA